MGKRQHYVPQFYLKQFADEESKIGFYRFASKKYQASVPVNSILFENWLYDKHDAYEKALSNKESQWNASLCKLLALIDERRSVDELSIEDMSQIMSFIVFAELRTTKSIYGFRFLMESLFRDMGMQFYNAPIGDFLSLKTLMSIILQRRFYLTLPRSYLKHTQILDGCS